jgi:hypothetical protein
MALPLTEYATPHLYMWRCSCGFREEVRLFLRPCIRSRVCPSCRHGVAHLTDEAIVVFSSGLQPQKQKGLP